MSAAHIDFDVPVADGEPPICPWWIERGEGWAGATRADHAGRTRASVLEDEGGCEYSAYGPDLAIWAHDEAPTLAEAMAAADRALRERGAGYRPPPPSLSRWYYQLAVGSPVLLERRLTSIETVGAVRNEGGDRQVYVCGEWYSLAAYGRALPLVPRIEQRAVAQATRRARHEVRMRAIAARKAGGGE